MRSSHSTMQHNPSTTQAACMFLLDSVSVPVTQGDFFHSQANVMNGGADKPSSSELTSLPGMYNGFTWPNIWVDSLDGFVVAGPKVVSFAGGDSPDPSSAPSPSSVSSSSVPPYSYSTATSPRLQSTGTPANPTSTPANPTSTPANPVNTPGNPTNTPANPTSTSTCRSKKSDERPLPTHRVHRRSARH